jgi:hypothetical protein
MDEGSGEFEESGGRAAARLREQLEREFGAPPLEGMPSDPSEHGAHAEEGGEEPPSTGGDESGSS